MRKILSRFILALAAPALLSLPALALPACPPGWDHTKWNNPAVTSPKYVVGRIIAQYPHTPNGLKKAMPEINIAYPGSKQIDDHSDDKADIPCVGIIDLVVAADGPDVGRAWAWQVVKDRCGECTPRLCSPPAPETGGGHGGGGDTAPIPNMLELVKGVKTANAEAFAKQADPQRCGDGEFLEKVVLALQAKDKKFANNCKNGNCAEVSQDAVAYYAGPDHPYNGAKNVVIFKVITDRCKPGAAVAWSKIGPPEVGAWSNRAREQIDHTTGVCTYSSSRPCVDGMRIDVRTPNGHCANHTPGEGFQRRDGDWIRVLGPCSAFPQ